MGEGLFLTEDQVAWVDIAENRLYLRDRQGGQYFDLDIKATVILSSIDNNLLIASSGGLGLIDVRTGYYRETVNYSRLFCSETHRTNDGCKLSDGRYLVATMHESAPEKYAGAVFLINSDGTATLLFDDIHISNTLIELANGNVLITDSQTGTIFLCQLNVSSKICKRLVWYQAEPGVAPDGGCRLSDRHIAVAMWGGACIRIFEEAGVPMADLVVPAKFPTNTKFSERQAVLWVTSASEGLTEAHLNQYPLLGKTFCIDDPLTTVCS